MQKFKFDARSGPTSDSRDLYSSPWKYSFVHNFKVHFKSSMFQALANKLDVSISSTTPQIPSTQLVMEEFNQRMQMGNMGRNMKQRFSATSYHVSDIEYKESLAFYDPQTAPKSPPEPTSPQGQTFPHAAPTPGSLLCRNCGAQQPSDSKFCNKCGTGVLT